MLAKTPDPDAFEALFAAATGLFFSLYDELDPRARRRAVASLRGASPARIRLPPSYVGAPLPLPPAA